MIIDTTLREGEQLYGAYFSPETRREFLLDLEAAGVREAEVGWAGQPGIGDMISWAESSLGAMAVSVWSPCRVADVEELFMLGARRISIAMPVSDAHLEKRLSTSRKHALEMLESALGRAVELGFESVRVGLEDFSRSDVDFALEAGRRAAWLGADCLRLADTVGVWSPRDMVHTVSLFRSCLPLEIGVHCHDDFGMATANAVTALQSGAAFADCAVLGIGERSGISALEEVAAWLDVRGEADFDLPRLAELCRKVSHKAKVALPRTKAVAGEDIFACESGIHVHGLSKDPSLYEPYPPEMVGAGRKRGLGAKSGRGAVASVARDMGLDLSGPGLMNVLETVRRRAMGLGRPLEPDEVFSSR